MRLHFMARWKPSRVDVYSDIVFVSDCKDGGEQKARAGVISAEARRNRWKTKCSRPTRHLDLSVREDAGLCVPAMMHALISWAYPAR